VIYPYTFRRTIHLPRPRRFDCLNELLYAILSTRQHWTSICIALISRQQKAPFMFP